MVRQPKTIGLEIDLPETHISRDRGKGHALLALSYRLFGVARLVDGGAQQQDGNGEPENESLNCKHVGFGRSGEKQDRSVQSTPDEDGGDQQYGAARAF